MIRHIILDSSPLGLLSNPSESSEVLAITQWSRVCLAAGHQFYIPEVIDYELRRELLRAKKFKGIAKLDSLKSLFNYVPITTSAMLIAAELWSQSRLGGVPTGDPKKLDIDVILAAQGLTLSAPSSECIVATANVNHISRFLPADLWTNIVP